MKKISVWVIILFCLVVFASGSAVAQDVWKVVVSSQKFMVNGANVKVDALNIDGYNYAKIADIAAVLDVDITYDQTTNTVSIDKSKKYNGVNIIKNPEPVNNPEPVSTASPVEYDVNNAYEVFSYDDLKKAVESTKNTIVIKRDIDISGEFLSVGPAQTVIIEKGVTVKISMYNFDVYGQIINQGTISVPGRICFFEESPQIGVIKTTEYGEIRFTGDVFGVDEINKYLKADSIYTALAFVPFEKSEVNINKDLTIAKGKHLWLNTNCTLIVPEGVTLTINGRLTAYGELIIRGKVIGEISK